MDRTELTELLAGWSRDGRDGLDRFLPLIYDELHNLARHHLAGIHETPTLQPTMLVHEAYLRLAAAQPRDFPHRRHFFAYASRIIRHSLVDHIRSRKSQKRGSGQVLGSDALEEAASGGGLSPDLLLSLNDALDRLESVDTRQARIVEMKFFGGLRQTEIAEALEVSLPTVERHWSAGKRRLALFLNASPNQ